MENWTDTLLEWAYLFGPKIIGALVIVILGRIGVGIVAGIIRRLMLRSKVDETLIKFVVSLTRIVLLVFVFIAALGTLGFETTSFVAIIGAAGLAVGFALQGSLSNFAVRPWVKIADYWDVLFDITENVKLIFDREGISIPFPQQDVHMYQVTGS